MKKKGNLPNNQRKPNVGSASGNRSEYVVGKQSLRHGEELLRSRSVIGIYE